MAVIPLSLTEEQRALRDSVNDICKRYPGEYWRELDAKREYPEAFVAELTKAGYLGCLVPEEYGGARGALPGGRRILRNIHPAGGHAGAGHGQRVLLGTVLA